MSNKPPVFHINPRGGLANRLIQYMVALTIRQNVPGLVVSNIRIPEWNIHLGPIQRDGTGYIHPNTNRLEVARIIDAFTSRSIDYVEYGWYGQWFDNFLPVEAYRDLLQDIDTTSGWDERHLLINIRGGEILDGRHPSYTLIPIDFYRDIITLTKLTPVFMGQLDTNLYCDDLRRRFPTAIFQQSQGPVKDFHILRHSKNIIPSISTFSWVASWLSSASIFFPLFGLFNPFQEALIRLVPLSDRRYRFFQFPLSYSVPVETYRRSHKSIRGLWNEVTPAMLSTRLNQWPRFSPPKEAYLRLLDPVFYRRMYKDLASAYSGDNSKLERHYHDHGFSERRVPFEFDEKFYVLNHPQAAVEVGSGDFQSPLHHYVGIGNQRGYRPCR